MGAATKFIRRTIARLPGHKPPPVPPGDVKPKPRITKKQARWIAEMEQLDLPVPLTHYHSPMPNIPVVVANSARWYRPSPLTGIDFDLSRQRAALARLEPYRAESDALPTMGQVIEMGYGFGYGDVEAPLLYQMVRAVKPKRIIEIGSGVSTWYILQALARNKRERAAGELVSVDPNPSDKLRELLASANVELKASQVQEFDVTFYDRLGEGDILFIDSSHVSKVDSDVNWLVLEVLPCLRPGVIVHFHDIMFPYPTCPPTHPLFRLTTLWNETALLQAFLTYNKEFAILFCTSYLHANDPDSLKRLVPHYDTAVHFPSSVWLQRRSRV